MKCLNLVALIVLVLGFLVYARADVKPTVAVNFKIAKQQYRRHFPSDIDQVEAECTKRIVQILNEQFGYLEFAEGVGSSSLDITLDDQDPDSHSTMQETGFWICLDGPCERKDKVYWPFREATECDVSLGEKEPFVEKVCTKLDPNFSETSDLLVATVFSRILITKKVHPFRQHLCLVLPLRMSDSRINEGSQFDIHVVFVGDMWDTPRQYTLAALRAYKKDDLPQLFHKGIVAEAFSPREHLNQFKGDDEMTVEGLYVVKYVPYYEKKQEKEAPVPPDQLLEDE